ncbi:MAG: hypothetical protein JOZ22_04410 [Acidobacteriia bacterium]|nr:hypothetical protein [Terriglobia bacterium]
MLRSQQQSTPSTPVTVPKLIRFTGTFVPANGLPTAPFEGVTLAIYREQQGGTPLWQETQNVAVDRNGQYAVLLGNTRDEGLPPDLFASGEPRWLGVQFDRPGETEQSRILLASVPYALKAADAETLGGLPAAAYLRASGTAADSATGTAPSAAEPKALKLHAITGTPVTNSLVKFTDSAGDMSNSIIADNGSSIAVAGQAAVGSGHAPQSYGFDLYVNGVNPAALIDSYGNPGTASLLLQGRNSGGGASNQTLSVNGAGMFTITPSGTGTSALAISQNGNIGIGTAAPASKLTVIGQAAIGSGGSTQTWGNDLYINASNPTVMLDSYANPGTASLLLQGRGATVTNHRVTVNSTGLFSIVPSSSGTALSITQSGNVGIGTTTPAVKLEIAGMLKLDGTGNGITFPDGTQQTTAAVGGSGSAGPPGPNTQAIALLRWYSANLTTQFPTGAGPAGVAFDGDNIWIANESDNTVSKLQASSGAILGSFSVGSGPRALAFDGANIWVANYGGNTVSKLRGVDGFTLGTFNVGGIPCGVAFDGGNIWVANFGSNTVTELQASTGALLGTFAVGSNPCGIAFDGTYIWVANYGGNTVMKLLANSGSVVGTFPVGTSPRSVTFDGTNIWVANYGSNNLTRLLAASGATVATFNVGSNPAGAAFDGTNIWVANSGNNTVTKLQASNGATLGTVPVGFAPNGVAFDGANVWVSNSSSNSVSKL